MTESKTQECLVLSIPAVAKMLGISRVTGYKLAHDGTLPVISLGRKLAVPQIALERMLNEAGKLKEDQCEVK